MWTETPIFLEDLEYLAECGYIPWDQLKGKTIFVTGATGLIGYTLVSALLYYEQKHHIGLNVIALVRNREQGEKKFGKQLAEGCSLKLLEGRIEDSLQYKGAVDYIIHGACPTASTFFVQHPVETIEAIVISTRNVLEFAKEKQVSGCVYLSSMEVYGYPEKGHKVREVEVGHLSPLEVRNSYPIGKLQCESLCCAYASEYGLTVMIARLTQTFGPGVSYDDGRVFAEFARCVKEKRNIVLKTKGETERSYLYTADAAAAILTILLKGKSGQAYNVADESTYCSVAEMAQMLAHSNEIEVSFDLESGDKSMYLSVLYMDLDTSLLRNLKWSPIACEKRNTSISKLEIMYQNMMECM